MDKVETAAPEPVTPEPAAKIVEATPVVETVPEPVAVEPVITEREVEKIEDLSEFYSKKPHLLEKLKEETAKKLGGEVAQVKTELYNELAKRDALIDNPNLTRDDMDLITGDTPEQIKANAAKLAARIGTPAKPETATAVETAPQVVAEPAPEPTVQAGPALPVPGNEAPKEMTVDEMITAVVGDNKGQDFLEKGYKAGNNV